MLSAIYADLHGARDGDYRADKVIFQAGISGLLHNINLFFPCARGLTLL